MKTTRKLKSKSVSKLKARKKPNQSQNEKTQVPDNFSDFKFVDTDGKVYKGKEALQKNAEEMLKFFRPTISDKPFGNSSKPMVVFVAKHKPCPEGYREIPSTYEKEKMKKIIKAIPGFSHTKAEEIMRRDGIIGDEQIKDLTVKDYLILLEDYISVDSAVKLLSEMSEVGSKHLLQDLILDSVQKQDGVWLDEKRHGKNQPKKLRKVSHEHGYDNIANRIKLRKNKVFFHPFSG